MGKLAITLAAAALMLGSMALTAGAQTQQAGASSFNTLMRNATPLHEVACRGRGGACPWGWFRVCNPMRCWCRPC
jgi:hypothetical protein